VFTFTLGRSKKSRYELKLFIILILVVITSPSDRSGDLASSRVCFLFPDTDEFQSVLHVLQILILEFNAHRFRLKMFKHAAHASRIVYSVSLNFSN